jgi:DNA polymerase III sliding clamp (beta) subunit (PCNA family)
VTGVIGKFKKSYFENYDNSLGTIQIPLSDLIEVMSKIFKTDKTIDISLVNNRLILQGELEVFGTDVPNIELPMIPTDKIKETQYGFMSKKHEIKAIYKMDISLLNVEVLNVDTVTFKYGKGLDAILQTETSSYKRRILAEEVNAEETGEITFFLDYLKRITRNVKGVIYLLFTNEPIIISQITDNYAISYLVAPKVEE